MGYINENSIINKKIIHGFDARDYQTTRKYFSYGKYVKILSAFKKNV